ncbi:hypothetical protein R1flu_024747 [Riccia fluitans]|uniref:Uncharacterized protein n=1 Tax=Riccia fluitans TaxID=41844 RepID=A0ABD1XVS9_9MARC
MRRLSLSPLRWYGMSICVRSGEYTCHLGESNVERAGVALARTRPHTRMIWPSGHGVHSAEPSHPMATIPLLMSGLPQQALTWTLHSRACIVVRIEAGLGRKATRLPRSRYGRATEGISIWSPTWRHSQAARTTGNIPSEPTKLEARDEACSKPIQSAYCGSTDTSDIANNHTIAGNGGIHDPIWKQETEWIGFDKAEVRRRSAIALTLGRGLEHTHRSYLKNHRSVAPNRRKGARFLGVSVLFHFGRHEVLCLHSENPHRHRTDSSIGKSAEIPNTRALDTERRVPGLFPLGASVRVLAWVADLIIGSRGFGSFLVNAPLDASSFHHSLGSRLC